MPKLGDEKFFILVMINLGFVNILSRGDIRYGDDEHLRRWKNVSNICGK